MKSDLIVSSPIKRTKEQLTRLQALPLDQKVSLTLRRIEQFYTELNGKVYISFSGGKDSTVLLHLVRSIHPEVKAVFCDTGLEYPEIKTFVKSSKNVEWLQPKIPFHKVIKKYGFPVPSKEVSQKIEEIRNTKSDKLRDKRMFGDNKGNGKLPLQWQFLINAPFKISGRCCNIMKKDPAKRFEKATGLFPITGTMAQESRLREQHWLEKGCNMFDSARPISNPLSFWTDKDVWNYLNTKQLPNVILKRIFRKIITFKEFAYWIKTRKIMYSKIYDMGEERTGCMFCLFGCQFDDHDGRPRFDKMKISHPKQYALCEKMGVLEVLNYLDKRLGRDQLEMFNNEEIN